MSELDVRLLTGQAIADALDDVAQLRIAVFRDWPYLYDGSLEYERRYLAAYAESDTAIVVAAYDGDRMIGASTASALTEHKGDFAAAFEGSGIALSDVYYLAESVLLPKYRGRGLGHRFFDEREAQAGRLGLPRTAFCSVMRDQGDPRRPADYRPLDAFWRGRGYAPLDDVVARFSWRDVGDEGETEKPLQFWSKLQR